MTPAELDLQTMGVRPVVHYPTPAEAVQITPQNARRVAAWCGAWFWPRPVRLWVPTDQRRRRARVGDYVVKRDGRFWPMRAGVFAGQYRTVPKEG